MILFDTGKKLEKAFTPEQVEALIHVLDERDQSLATKTDLTALESSLNATIREMKAELSASVANMRADVLKWTVGLIFTQTAVIVGVLALILKS